MFRKPVSLGQDFSVISKPVTRFNGVPMGENTEPGSEITLEEAGSQIWKSHSIEKTWFGVCSTS